MTSTSLEAAGFLVETHDLGPLGTAQEVVALVILVVKFGLIVSEGKQPKSFNFLFMIICRSRYHGCQTVIHRALAAMIGAGIVIFLLAAEHRMPELDELVTWMDIPTLSLLWGMMVTRISFHSICS